MAEPAISTAKLGRMFGRVTALSGLDLTVERGELFGLVGPDGAGKTTTLRILAGIMRPSEGRAEVLGLDVRKKAERIKDHLAYMPQRFGQYGDLSVIENINFYADLYRVPKHKRRERIEMLLRASRMTRFQDRLARNLSGGMKQKMGLCCALVHEPEVLLLDEPTTGVDPVSRRDFWRILGDMRGHGVTVVMATTYLDEADRCTRVGLLHQGRLLMADEPPALRQHLQGALLALTGVDPYQARDVLRDASEIKHLNMFGAALHLVVDDEAPGREVVTRLLQGAGMGGFELEAVTPSLEDVYIALVESQARAAGTEEAASG
ncbi:MAG: ABC transporter ATP-binding protein [Proteobacteria bacterium]|nr:ABC transporter ATP-binding protein [Pseudomonadota bacterium]MBU1741620.1 ABC transporter ATP-binding protein [Pseudomonadota bacterium]